MFDEPEGVLAVSGPWLDAINRTCYCHLMEVNCPAMRVRILGEAYLPLLERGGFMRCKLS